MYQILIFCIFCKKILNDFYIFYGFYFFKLILYLFLKEIDTARFFQKIFYLYLGIVNSDLYKKL